MFHVNNIPVFLSLTINTKNLKLSVTLNSATFRAFVKN